MTNFIVENNLPIAVADKCGPCSEICCHIRKLIVNQYQCAKSIFVCILNRALYKFYFRQFCYVSFNLIIRRFLC
jgi:hypothetical protein